MKARAGGVEGLALPFGRLLFRDDRLCEVDHGFPTVWGFLHERHRVARFEGTDPPDQALPVPVKRLAAHEGMESVVILLILLAGKTAVRTPGVRSSPDPVKEQVEASVPREQSCEAVRHGTRYFNLT